MQNHKYDNQCTIQVHIVTLIVQYFTFTRYKHEKPVYVPLGPFLYIYISDNYNMNFDHLCIGNH